MQYFPIFLDADKLTAVIIGGGSVAARKLELVCKTAAKVIVVSPQINQTVKTLIDRHDIQWHQVQYDKTLIQHANLVIAATNDGKTNAQISADANALNILVNVVDSPELCTYITPAIIDRDPMLIALSSSGSAPILLQMLKSQIEQTLPSHYGKLAQFCGENRRQVQALINDFASRKSFWQETLTGKIAELIFDDETTAAQQLFKEQLSEYQQHKPHQVGQLSIVVTQDNNPDLLTLSAYQALQIADVVYLEPHLSQNFYEFARRDSEKAPAFDLAALHSDIESGQRVVVITDNQHMLSKLEYRNVKVFVSGKSA
ncbi:hypothetical protein FE810_16520 [Thalassotalea litorea]|uniref:precorrin-2 dehydrogenase n=1 Tax=Thalassotalea litorea TaxID=2020715 RepID=A0A5R9IBF7_9GAMM|nr:bifunctional precorrin-2 dehydrogenase/sirohydrochlorin ferrochelatase [Thalassotalea litorea]TLU59945.1 hypothetical protein FE810_16520 [Thalassotalea litorea]